MCASRHSAISIDTYKVSFFHKKKKKEEKVLQKFASLMFLHYLRKGIFKSSKGQNN